MTAHPDIAETLTRGEVAAMLGISARQFGRAVKRGEMPAPLLNCCPQRWSRVQITKALAGEHGPGQSLSIVGDPIMEAIDRKWPASR